MAVFTTLALTTAITGLSVAGVIGVGAAIYGVAATVASTNAQKRSAKAQVAQQKVQQKRSRRSAIRSNILASARARATAQATGTASSSGIAGGVGSARSNLGGELGYGGQMSGLSQRITELGQKANMYGDIAKLSFSAAQSSASIAGVFEGPPAKAPTPKTVT